MYSYDELLSLPDEIIDIYYKIVFEKSSLRDSLFGGGLTLTKETKCGMLLWTGAEVYREKYQKVFLSVLEKYDG